MKIIQTISLESSLEAFLAANPNLPTNEIPKASSLIFDELKEAVGLKINLQDYQYYVQSEDQFYSNIIPLLNKYNLLNEALSSKMVSLEQVINISLKDLGKYKGIQIKTFNGKSFDTLLSELSDENKKAVFEKIYTDFKNIQSAHNERLTNLYFSIDQKSVNALKSQTNIVSIGENISDGLVYLASKYKELEKVISILPREYLIEDLKEAQQKYNKGANNLRDEKYHLSAIEAYILKNNLLGDLGGKIDASKASNVYNLIDTFAENDIEKTLSIYRQYENFDKGLYDYFNSYAAHPVLSSPSKEFADRLLKEIPEFSDYPLTKFFNSHNLDLRYKDQFNFYWEHFLPQERTKEDLKKSKNLKEIISQASRVGTLDTLLTVLNKMGVCAKDFPDVSSSISNESVNCVEGFNEAFKQGYPSHLMTSQILLICDRSSDTKTITALKKNGIIDIKSTAFYNSLVQVPNIKAIFSKYLPSESELFKLKTIDNDPLWANIFDGNLRKRFINYANKELKDLENSQIHKIDKNSNVLLNIITLNNNNRKDSNHSNRYSDIANMASGKEFFEKVIEILDLSDKNVNLKKVNDEGSNLFHELFRLDTQHIRDNGDFITCTFSSSCVIPKDLELLNEVFLQRNEKGNTVLDTLFTYQKGREETKTLITDLEKPTPKHDKDRYTINLCKKNYEALINSIDYNAGKIFFEALSNQKYTVDGKEYNALDLFLENTVFLEINNTEKIQKIEQIVQAVKSNKAVTKTISNYISSEDQSNSLSFKL